MKWRETCTGEGFEAFPLTYQIFFQKMFFLIGGEGGILYEYGNITRIVS